MMTLSDASSFFDRTPITDPDNGKVLFYGQIDPYDESRRDGVGAYRRVLSVKPGTVIPTTRAIRAFGQVWVMGIREVDGLAQMHREKYVLQPASLKMSVGSLNEFLAGTAASSAWADIEWLKDSREEEVSSSVVPLLTVYFADGTSVHENDVVWSGADAYLVESTRSLPSGLFAAIVIKLEYAVSAASHFARTYDPVAGAFNSPTATPVNCLRVRWQNLYRYDTQGEAKFQEGDTTLVVPSGTTITTADRITLAGKEWSVFGSEAFSGAVCIHARPA